MEDNGFETRDWALLATCAVLWGSSFLLIAEGLEAFPPALVALLRLTFGFVALLAFPAARRRVARADWARVALLGTVWMAAPLVLFPLAQRHIDSSVAGMLNGGVPLFAAVVAALIARAVPRPRRIVGLLAGFAGVVAVMLPAASGASTSALGVGMVVLATAFYGLAINLAVPLQRRYGALPVLVRAQAFALLLVAPWGLVSIPQASFQLSSMLAMIVLGVGGTGLAFVAMSTLSGRRRCDPRVGRDLLHPDRRDRAGRCLQGRAGHHLGPRRHGAGPRRRLAREPGRRPPHRPRPGGRRPRGGRARSAVGRGHRPLTTT